MRIKNSKNWVRHSPNNSVSGALLILLIAFLIRLRIHPLVEPYAPFHLFIVACTIIAFFYGYKLALLSIALSIALGGYYFVKPYQILGPLNELHPTDWLQFFNFFLVSLVAIFFIEKLQRNIFERDLLLKVMQSRYRIELIKKNESQISLGKKI